MADTILDALNELVKKQGGDTTDNKLIVDALNDISAKYGGESDNKLIVDALNDIVDNYSGGSSGLELAEVEVIIDGLGENVTTQYADITGCICNIAALRYNEGDQQIHFNMEWSLMYPSEGTYSNNIKLLMPKNVVDFFGDGYAKFALPYHIFGGSYSEDDFWFSVSSADCLSSNNIDSTTTIVSNGTIRLVLDTDN